MGMGPLKCMPGFPTAYSNLLTEQLERHASLMDASYRASQLQWLTALSTLHDAVDAALADDAAAAACHLIAGQQHLASGNDHLTTLGHALVELRSDLFERGIADPAEPLIVREPFFATLDYDDLYRELAERGAVLPNRAFWDDTASRMRDGGARAGIRLLERHLRELQSDLRSFVAEVEVTGRLPLRAMAEALHGASFVVARVMTGYTRLITTFGYVSLLCERATHAYEEAARRPDDLPALAAS